MRLCSPTQMTTGGRLISSCSMAQGRMQHLSYGAFRLYQPEAAARLAYTSSKHDVVLVDNEVNLPAGRHCFQLDSVPCRVYGIPSYYVQKLFSHAQGVSYAPSTATSDHSLVHNELVAASATCQDHNCTHLALKVCFPLCQPADHLRPLPNVHVLAAF